MGHHQGEARLTGAGGRSIGPVVTVAVVTAVLTIAGCSSGGGHAAATTAVTAKKTDATAGSGAAHATSAPTAPATFAGPDGVEARWVVQENKKLGTTAWRLSGEANGASINGFANVTAASGGQKVSLYVTTHADRYHISAYRIGYYGGTGGRLVWKSGELKGVTQPNCTMTTSTNMVACDNWAPSVTVTIGPQFVQGDYLFKLVADPGQQSYIPLAVWDPSSHATYVIQNSVLTWQGWNNWGGYDMYGGAPPGQTPQYANRALVESFDRPYANGNGAGDFMALEYPLIYWAEQHGLDVTYWTDVTFAQFPYLLEDHKVLLTLGHDESWTLRERNGVVAARQDGVNVIYFGASPVLRHVRLLPSTMGRDREEVDYRDPTADPIYATDPLNATGNTWEQPPADDPPSEVVGDTYQGYGLDDPMVVTDANSWPFAGTGVTNGTRLNGIEAGDYDAYDTTQPDPPNVEVLSHSPVQPEVGHLMYADMTYYTWPQGDGGVLATGTIGWIPALEACTGTLPSCPSAVVQAVTGNILRLFGDGPAGKHHPSAANWQQYY